MSDTVEIKVDVRGLIDFGRQAGVKLSDISRITRIAAAPIVRAAKAAAPTKTRALRNSIRSPRSRYTIRVMAGGKRATYAPVAHWGWDGVSGPKFLTRAFNARVNESIQILENKLLEEIGKL